MKIAMDVDESYPIYKAYDLDHYNVEKDTIVADMSDIDYAIYMAIERVHKLMQNKLQTMYRKALCEEDNA